MSKSRAEKVALQEDLFVAAMFLVWAEEDGAYYGRQNAGEAYEALCRIASVDSARLRDIIKGNF